MRPDMPFDPCHLPHPAMRYPIIAHGGMVNASSPQAAASGLQALLKGGNAVDAAVAAAAALTVVEPTANGIGGDAFALVWMQQEGKLYGLNASGRAPLALTIDKARAAGAQDKMPTQGWLPTMVPGVPAAWAALNQRFGRLDMADSLAPAITYAREGYPVSPVLAQMWQRAFNYYRQALKGEAFAEWFATFAPEGEAPRCGQMVRLPHHASSLESIASTAARSFYQGDLMARMVRDSQAYGGFFQEEDFASYQPEWVEPISVAYRGYQVCEIPPNGQGIVALMALNILSHFDLSSMDDAQRIHLQWEAMKMAFADGKRFVTDPRHMDIKAEQLLHSDYGKQRAGDITGQAAMPQAGSPKGSGTVYLCTADREGNMVSYIQSNYMGFGSGIVIRDTGISLQNRGADFSLDPQDINCLAPGKKSYHTIIPGFLLKDGQAIGPFGVMGGYMQPQGHVQVVSNLLDAGLNPQQALDAPRWQWMRDKRFAVESGFSPAVARQLQAKGHQVDMLPDPTSFGRGQMIWKLPNGSLVGATEGRTDSSIASC